MKTTTEIMAPPAEPTASTEPTALAEPTVPADPPPVRLFGLALDPVTTDQAVARVRRWARAWAADGRPAGATKVVVTPNVDHLVKLHEGFKDDPGKRAAVWAAYTAADLTTADGAPVVAAAKLFGEPLPARVAGSDLVPALLAAGTADEPVRIFLLGAPPGVADAAAEQIARTYPHAEVVGTHCPPLGFEHDAGENATILRLLDDAAPDVLCVGLGFPKQELWVHAHRDRLRCGVALCVGATIDFLAGNRARCPAWMAKAGLEWTFRLYLEPGRLAGRYARDAAGFPKVLWREWRGGPKS